MDGTIKSSTGKIGSVRIDIGQAMSSLVQNDLHFEMTLYAIIEILKNKKDKDGNPIITQEELEAKAKEGADKIRSSTSILQPETTPSGIIIPK